jgi:2-amino-1-hydroxyethylphosphonate dioxygenase (glycine-forming)
MLTGNYINVKESTTVFTQLAICYFYRSKKAVMREKSVQAKINELFALYEKYGDQDYIGEPVSQLEHMSQSAALAQAQGYDDEVILAAFFHDIGHLCAEEGQTVSMDGKGNVDHEQLGADYLRRLGFSERVARLVKSHVIAKRYLTYRFPAYYDRLSEASRITLGFQGGKMNEAEAADFEADPDAALTIQLRLWDDAAKETGVPVDNLNALKSMAMQHLKGFGDGVDKKGISDT